VDEAARQRFEQLVRATICRELDQVTNEIEVLRKEVAALRAASGLPTGSLRQAERREQVVALRARGVSLRAIARLLNSRHETIAADLKALGVPKASISIGLDGATRHHAPR
jgi:hypothetical protein